MTTATKAQIPTTPSELKYWTAFHRIPGVGRVRYQALLDRFGWLAEAWSAGPTDLRSAGLDDRVVRAIATERPNIDPDSELDRLEKHGTRALTWNDDAYPALLKEIDDAPPVLYVRGDISAIDEWAVSVVGTRRPTPYGRQVAEEISYQLASHHISVVSGLARRLDALPHPPPIPPPPPPISVAGAACPAAWPPSPIAPPSRRAAEPSPCSPAAWISSTRRSTPGWPARSWSTAL